MKNSSKVLTLGVGLLMLGSSAAYALTSENSSVSDVSVQRPNQEIFEALENKDFDAFSSLYKDKTGEVLSSDAFLKILELHNLRNSERQIREDLDEMGVKMPGFGGKGMGKGGRGMNGEPMMNNLTDEQKALMTEARELRRNGDIEGADKLLSDTGIEIPKGFQNKRGNR
jgi:hypothetical protein